MSYVVLARKWRPQTFADLTGQEHIARTLTNAIERERVPHAMLFTGARGVGKTSSARIVAMALNCEEGPSPSPCGVCSACTEIQRSQSVDVLEIDGASNRGISEIRELRESVRYAPQTGRFKVYIIDEVHMLTTEAFNALLKTLEEPPPHVVFIFATTEVQKIPVTILSRCQRFDFRRIRPQAIIGRLRHIAEAEELKIDEDVLALVARQANGGMRDALSLLDQLIAFSGTTLDLQMAAEILGAADRRRLFEMSEAILTRDVDLALRSLDGVLEHGLDVTHFATEFVTHLRDLAVVSVARAPEALTALSEGELALCREQAARTTPDVLQRAFEIMVVEAETISRSPWPRLVFEMALVKLCSLESLQPIDALIERLEALSDGRRLPPQRGGEGGAPGSDGGAGAPGGSPRNRAARNASEAPPEVKAAPVPGQEVRPPGDVADTVAQNEAQPQGDTGDTAPGPGEVEPKAGPELRPEPEHGPERELRPEPELKAGPELRPEPEPGPGAETQLGKEPDGEMHSDGGGATSTASAPPLLDRKVTFEEWRRVVVELDAESTPRGRMLARALVHLDVPGHVRVAVHPQLIDRLADDVPEDLAARLSRVTGARVSLDLIAISDMSDEERSVSRQLSEQEDLEEEARREELRTRMARHPAVHLLRERWPDAELRIRFRTPD